MSSEFLDKDIVYVNSAVRQSGITNDFYIDLSQQIKKPNSYDSVTLLNFSCPKSYYLFNNNNNQFIVNEGVFSTTITIPIGNYDIFSLISQLTTLLASCHWTYTITDGFQLTSKLTFNVSGNGGVQPSFNMSLQNSPYLILGFEQNIYNFSTNSLTSENCVNIRLTNTIQLLTNIVKNNVLSTIVPDTPDNSIILYTEQNPSFTSQDLIINQVLTARFWIVDGNTQLPLNLNGLDMNFSFAIYKKNNYFSSMIKANLLQNEIDSLQN